MHEVIIVTPANFGLLMYPALPVTPDVAISEPPSKHVQKGTLTWTRRRRRTLVRLPSHTVVLYHMRVHASWPIFTTPYRYSGTTVASTCDFCVRDRAASRRAHIDDESTISL